MELYLIDLYTEWLEYESAEKVAMEVLKKNPKNVEGYERLLNILDLKNEQDRILEIHEEYKGKIKSEKSLLYIAKTYLIKGDKEKAEDILKSIDVEKAKDIPIYYIVDYGLHNEKNLSLIQGYTADVNGDSREENVVFMAARDEMGFSETLELIIQDASNGNIIDIISLSDFPGYPYDFKLVDANNDGSLDILVVIHSGGTSDLRAIILEMVNYWMMTWDTCTIPT